MTDTAKKSLPKWLVPLLVAGVVVAVSSNVYNRLESRLADETTSAPVPAEGEAEGASQPPQREAKFADGQVTEESVLATLGNVNDVAVEIQDNLGTDAPDDKIIHVTYSPEGVADQSPRLTLMDLAKVSATVFERLFAHQAVSAVDVTAQVTMVYTDGSEKTEAGARIYWDRAKAATVDFKQYRENVAESYFWDAYVGAPDFYVHPGVLSGLSDADQAKLKK